MSEGILRDSNKGEAIGGKVEAWYCWKVNEGI